MHALQRAQERMRKNTSVEDIYLMINRIQYDVGGSAWYLQSAKNKCEEWVVRHNDCYWLVIYDPNRQWMVTIYQPPTKQQIKSAKRALKLVRGT